MVPQGEDCGLLLSLFLDMVELFSETNLICRDITLYFALLMQQWIVVVIISGYGRAFFQKPV